MKKSLYVKKTILLILGMFFLALGVAIAVKAGLGVSPMSCIPNVLSSIFPISFGTITVLFYLCFILLQILLLRKEFKPFNLLQLPLSFLFGYFTDFTLNLLSSIEIEHYGMRLAYALLSNVVGAFGIFLEVKANLMMMPSEGAITAISKKTGKDFGIIKMIFDWGYIGAACIISLLVFGEIEGIREGTLIGALTAGMCVRFYNRHIHFIDNFLKVKGASRDNLSDSTVTTESEVIPLVITIERELGSGGHEIGKILAERLGITFYDHNAIAMAAQEMGLPADYINHNDPQFGIGLTNMLYRESIATSNTKSKNEELFETQKAVINHLAAKESCVIVGRLGGYALRNRPNTINIFLSGTEEFRAGRVAAAMNIPVTEAKTILRREDRLRIDYCHEFTGAPWGIAAHYDMTAKVSTYGIEKTAELLFMGLNLEKRNEVNN